MLGGKGVFRSCSLFQLLPVSNAFVPTHSSPATRQCGGHASDEPRNAIAPATCPPHAADAAMVAKACPPRQTPSSHLVEGTVASKRGKSDNVAV